MPVHQPTNVQERLLALTEVSGSARDAGKQYGSAFEPEIMAFARDQVAPNKARLAYARKCWRHVERTSPTSAAFMRGMADGAHLSLDHVTLLSLHEEIVHQPHCTAFAATGSATRDGGTLVAMNWDWNANLYPWPGLLRLAVRGRPRVLTYHYPGLWAGAGMNEHGLAFMWTGSGYMPKVPPVVGVPTYVLIAELLWRRDVPEVLAYLRGVTLAGAFIFFLGDPSGRIAVVEGLPGRLIVDDSAAVLSRANHYACAEAITCSKQQATFPRTTSTGYRAARMAKLMKQHQGRLDVRRSRAVLLDRDGPGPWIHQFPFGKQAAALGGMTIDSLLADCRRRELHTCRGGRRPGPWQRVPV